MKIHYFEDEDLRILASLAIDFFTDDMYFKVIRYSNVADNYWSFDCRFASDEYKIETHYDSLHFDCGNKNDPSTYQMAWTIKRGDKFSQRPITSPLLVVHQFEVLCKKQAIKMN